MLWELEELHESAHVNDIMPGKDILCPQQEKMQRLAQQACNDCATALDLDNRCIAAYTLHSKLLRLMGDHWVDYAAVEFSLNEFAKDTYFSPESSYGTPSLVSDARHAQLLHIAAKSALAGK